MKACTSCRIIIKEKAIKCPRCGSKDITDHFGGIVIILDPEKSRVASYLSLNNSGEYALYFK